MARIPETELERLRREVPIRELVEASGVELRRHGSKDLVGRCPFHGPDREPSLVVTPGKNLFNCFGCEKGGGPIDWVILSQNVSFRHAVEILRRRLDPLAAPTAPAAAETTPAPGLPPVPSPDADDQAVLDQVTSFYHETLLRSPEALEYLESRGLRNEEAIEHFKLGFSNRTLGYRLPPGRAGLPVRERLHELGFLRDTGFELMVGSLTIPILDEQGHTEGLYGRKVGKRLRKGTPLHLYLPGPHRGVFNETGLSCGDGEVILCEALIDALTFWCAGLRNVTSSYGVQGFTKDHLATFERHGVKRVLLAYDRDDAGDRAADALAEKLLAAGYSCSRVLFPRGMDANDFALKVRPASKSLTAAVRSAVWLGKGKSQPRPAAPPPTPISPLPATPAAPAAGPVSHQAPPTARPTPASAAATPAAPAPTPVSATPATSATTPPPTTPRPAPPPAPAATTTVPTPHGPAVVPAPPPAAAVPPSTPTVPVERHEHEELVRLGDRTYRVRGLANNQAYDQMKVNLLVSRGERYHVDTLELYSARQRGVFVKEAATELGVEAEVVKGDVGRVLLALEQLQDEQIRAAAKGTEPEPVTLTEEERIEALALLHDPHLVNRILDDFELTGLVGEVTNKLVGYLAAVSRKLEDPLAVIVQSSSAAGKTALQDAILSFVPEEERVKYSALTGQSLYYMGGRDLRHKVLAVAEEEGAARASYALKLLQSEGELTIASTGKDPATGKLVTHEYRVEGPVMILLTTTAVEVDEELRNRCLVLTVDEERGQTRAIHERQRAGQTLEGLLVRRDRDERLKVHRNAQRLLRPLLVANPWARQLTFLDDKTRMRRDHVKYLTLIRAIALLHQYQRPVRRAEHRGVVVEYVEVTVEDIALANRLAHEVLGRTLDELAPQTRRLLLQVWEMVERERALAGVERSEYRFTRRQVREYTGLGATQLRIHLDRLEELEYLLPHRGLRGQSFVYELLYDGQGNDGRPFLSGLIDPDRLEDDAKLAGPKRAHDGPKTGGCRSARMPGNDGSEAPFKGFVATEPQESHIGPEGLERRRLDARGV